MVVTPLTTCKYFTVYESFLLNGIPPPGSDNTGKTEKTNDLSKIKLVMYLDVQKNGL